MKWTLRIILTGLLLSSFALHAQIAAPTLTQTVTAPLINPASFTLTSSPNPSLTTQAVTYSGTVTGATGSPTPTGTVTVCDGGTGTTCTGGLAVATVTLSSTGGYTCTESNMTVGKHTITAHYSGDSVYAASN